MRFLSETDRLSDNGSLTCQWMGRNYYKVSHFINMSSSEKLMVGAPGEAPLHLASEPTPPAGTPRRGRPVKVVALSVALLLLVAGLVLLVRHKSGAARANSPISVPPPAVAQILRLKGTTQAIRSRAILAPMLSGQQVGSLTITRLSSAGSRVKRGDLLVEFDRQAQIRDFLDKQAEYNKLVGQVSEQQAKEDVTRAKDETELHQAESDLKSAELEIRKVELMSRIDVEKAQQSLEQAKATFAQLKETFDLKRKAARAAIRILEIQRDRTRRIMQNAQTNAELMQIRSPLDGVVVLNTIWKTGRMDEVQEGDQVRAGVPFMQVVDPSVMQVQVLVNQEDVLGLQIGQAATVRVDAYPDLELAGKFERISPVGRGGTFSAKIRSFTATFSIQGSDPRLMPDLSAAVDVISDVHGKPTNSRHD
jgi:HlyD family secretion protein